ncbi:MAG: LysE family translocator [Alphaproteobacteria bacterium]
MPVDPVVLGAFVIAILAIVMSPGPDTMVILRCALSSGVSAGMAAVAGVQAGLLVHTALAVLGISLIIASSPILFSAVAIAGAGYLGWLGIQSFRGGGTLGLENVSQRTTMARSFRDAAMCNLLNPKVIILFLALLPNFVDTSREDVPTQLIALAVVLIAVNVVWQLPIAWAADAVRRWITGPMGQKLMSRISGAILLAFALLLLYDHFAR